MSLSTFAGVVARKAITSAATSLATDALKSAGRAAMSGRNTGRIPSAGDAARRIGRRRKATATGGTKTRGSNKRSRRGQKASASFTKDTGRTGSGTVVMKEHVDASSVMVMKTGVQPATEKYTAASYPTNAGASGLNFFVMEIFWVDFYMAYSSIGKLGTQHSAGISTELLHTDGQNCTADSVFLDTSQLSNVAVITLIKHSDLETIINGVPVNFQNNIRTQGGHTMPIRYSLTDGKGNGMLIAAPFLHFYGGTVGDALVGGFTARLNFRMKSVNATDFYRIKQSF